MRLRILRLRLGRISVADFNLAVVVVVAMMMSIHFIENNVYPDTCGSIIEMDGKQTSYPRSNEHTHSDVFFNPPTPHPTGQSIDSRRLHHSGLRG